MYRIFIRTFLIFEAIEKSFAIFKERKGKKYKNRQEIAKRQKDKTSEKQNKRKKKD